MRRLLVFAPCLAALVACGGSDFAGSNVLLIGIDTLRADHLGCYGYARPTSPRIDALAAEGVLFEQTTAQSPWTLPSFASILTGLLPSAHRAGEGRGWTRSRLDARIPTLATELKRAGWHTGSFVSNGFAGKNVGLAEGCDTEYHWIDSGAAVDHAIAFIRAHAGERFFAFVHLIDPHHPYQPSAEDAAAFVDPDYRGPVGAAYTAFPPPLDFTDADRRRVRDLYDGEVRASDRWVGRLVDVLRELDVLERTIVVVVADHGEELFEHGFNGHGHTLYDELLQVPWIIRFPGGRLRKRIDAQVRAMDVFPTVLDALGLQVPPNLQGVSRMPLVHGAPAAPGSALAVAEYLFFAPEQKAVRRNDFKLVYTPLQNAVRAFDLVNDPGERVDVAEKRAQDVTALRFVLERDVLRRGEGFQFAARSGREARRLHVRVIGGRLGDVGLVNGEPEDALVTTDDGRGAEATFVLPPAPADLQAADEDVLRFQVEGTAPFTLEADVDGRPADRLYIGTFKTAPHRQPWRFTADDERLVVPYPPVVPPDPSGEVRIALYRVRRPPPSTATLDARTRESLRQLGYVE